MPPGIRLPREAGEEVDVHQLLVREVAQPALSFDEGADPALGVRRQLFHGLEEVHVQVVPQGVDEHPDQRGFAPEVVDDERLVLTGLCRDPLQRESGVAVAPQHPLRCREDACRGG